MNAITTYLRSDDFRHALICLAAVGGVFYASYGFTNYMTSHRTHVGEIIFDWEYTIPFWAWTIVPYWSLNLFYGLAFFLCKNRTERYTYMKQLLFAQGIAITCFIFFPLQFSWHKPEASGLLGQLFASLAVFDKPYNQAPSLHIILSVVVGGFFWHKISQSRFAWTRWAWLAWVLLIAASVLTTYQHHFIDIPTGTLVGFLTLWLFGKPPIYTPTSITIDRKRWAIFYLTVASLSALIAFTVKGASLWLLWISVATLLVALAYAKIGAGAFQKDKNGRLSIAATILFLPYLFAVRANIAYWLRGKSQSHKIIDNIFVGSIVATRHFDAVIDVCAEFPCCKTPEHYVNVPMLDMVVPESEQLQRAVEALDNVVHSHGNSNGKILVACALGYGRSVAVIVAWLIAKGHAKNIDDATEIVKQAHPNMVLSDNVRNAIIGLRGIR